MSDFESKLNEMEESNRYFQKQEIQELISSTSDDNIKDILDSWFLFERLEKFSVNNTRAFITKYFNTLNILEELWKGWKIKWEKLWSFIKFLKDELEKKEKSGDLEYYSYILKILYSINKKNKNFYEKKYDSLEKKLDNDISREFNEIFMSLGSNEYFARNLTSMIIKEKEYSVKIIFISWINL